MALLWTSSDGNSSLISNERIYTLEELDEARCAVRLNLSKEPFTSDGCPTAFQWGGIKSMHTVIHFIYCMVGNFHGV